MVPCSTFKTLKTTQSKKTLTLKAFGKPPPNPRHFIPFYNTNLVQEESDYLVVTAVDGVEAVDAIEVEVGLVEVDAVEVVDTVEVVDAVEVVKAVEVEAVEVEAVEVEAVETDAVDAGGIEAVEVVDVDVSTGSLEPTKAFISSSHSAPFN